MIRVVKELPMTKEQEAVAQGIATPEHYQRRQFMSETERAPKLKRDVLGSWQCRSGNICSADLVRNGVEAATIAFRWEREPNFDDREDFRFGVDEAGSCTYGKAPILN